MDEIVMADCHRQLHKKELTNKKDQKSSNKKRNTIVEALILSYLSHSIIFLFFFALSQKPWKHFTFLK